MGTFRMPSLGADMDAGVVLEWLVQPGSAVKRGDIVAVVRTDKADVEVEIFESGVIGELLVAEGVSVGVGTPLATVLQTAPQQPAPQPRPSVVTPGERPRITPRARRVAAELGLDDEALTASVTSGPITGDSLLAGAASTPAPEAGPAPAAPSDSADRALAMRRAIGGLMARSKQEIPHYYLQSHIELAHPLAWLSRRNEQVPVTDRVLAVALLCKASALAAREHPELNGFWINGEHRRSESVHLGVAIALRGGGLVAPAVHDADTLSVDDLMAALRDLTARARAGRLRGSEMTDPTITVTNLGDQGVESVFGVIYAPQVALVGFGRIIEQPWAAEGRVGARPVVSTTLSADHRASDGHSGARFLGAIDRLLHKPEEL